MRRLPGIENGPLRYLAPVLAVGFVGVAVSIAIWYLMLAAENRASVQEFLSRADNQGSALQNGLNEYGDRLYAVRSLFDAKVPAFVHCGFGFGLVHVNLSPKPGYYALMDTIAWMAGAKFSARMTTSDPTVDGIKLTLSNGQQAMALWRIGAGSSSVEVSGSESTQSINANVAGTTTFAIKSPQVQDLTESPVWFVGDSLGLQ